MANTSRLGMVLSSAAAAMLLSGCASTGGRSQVASGFGGKADGDAGLAMKAAIALNANDIVGATGLAERAVARTPDDAGFRALLGNAYFAGGRFASAESAYKDSLAIYSNQPQVVLKLALVEIAQGKTTEAVAFLDAAREVLDPADYGLALALAGHAPAAVEALRQAASQPGADARVRQNLALAIALTGDWEGSRVIAAQDLPADQVDGRIRQWMQLAKPVRAFDQVVALTGVKPAASDPGQPVKLAFRKGETNTALAAPKLQGETTVMVPLPAPVPIAAPQPEPVAPAIAEAVPPAPPPADPAREPVVAAAVVEAPAPAPVVLAVAPPPPAPLARPSFTRSAAPRRVARVQHAALPLRAGKSTAVVQLGAFASADRVAAAWNAAARRHAALRAYAPMSARFNSGRGLVYRLSVRGFASGGEANALCASLRRAGGSCFVRNVAGDAPVQFASR